jgi:hypothetical protein
MQHESWEYAVNLSLYDKWSPLSVTEVIALLTDAPFIWGLAGGYAIEQFLGTPIRSHGDIDIVVFRDEQITLQRWLEGWQLYAADPPGTLRVWAEEEYLPFGIHDIWGYRQGAAAWELQIMLAETEGSAWFSRRDSAIRGPREDMITRYTGVPCIRVEIQLMYKAKALRPKDDQDFWACLRLMNASQKEWLKASLYTLYPEGHRWFDSL